MWRAAVIEDDTSWWGVIGRTRCKKGSDSGGRIRFLSSDARGEPQDVKFKGRDPLFMAMTLEREYVTMHRATGRGGDLLGPQLFDIGVTCANCEWATIIFLRRGRRGTTR